MGEVTSFAVRKTQSSRALLLVHGYSGDSHQTFGMLPAFLAGSPQLYDWDIHCIGYPTSLAPDITGVWAADPDLTSLAGWLGNTITGGRYAGYKELAFIAHSMGGLIVQRAMLHGGFLGRVRMLALFGTPSNGLRKAGLGAIFKRQVRDMKWGGPFIAGLRADWNSRFAGTLPFCFAAAAGLRDEFVPEESSIGCFPAQYHQRVPGDHLAMVKPRALDADVPLLLLNLLAAPCGPGRPRPARTPTALAAEESALRAGAADALGRDGLVKLALELETAGGQQRAIELLEPRHEGDTELTGVLAGRYKRRWLADPDEKAGEGRRALQLYTAAFEQASAASVHEQAYYNGINVAFMELALHGDREASRGVAERVIAHCEAARRNGADRWLLATEGEAALYTGRDDKAGRLYRLALEQLLEERERGSMLRQGIWACRLLDNREMEDRLTGLYDPASAGFPDLPEQGEGGTSPLSKS